MEHWGLGLMEPLLVQEMLESIQIQTPGQLGLKLLVQQLLQLGKLLPWLET